LVKISVEDNYIPQQATLDALKKYGRYIESENPSSPTPSIIQPGPPKVTSNFKRWKIVLIFLTVSAVIIGLLTLWFLQPKTISGKIRITHTEGPFTRYRFF
jgi:hypothetical protein